MVLILSVCSIVIAIVALVQGEPIETALPLLIISLIAVAIGVSSFLNNRTRTRFAKIPESEGEATPTPPSDAKVTEEVPETQTELKTIFCRYCGYENENDATFCQQCGKNVSPKAISKISESTEFTPKYLQCFVCGAKNKSSAKFCKKCGISIE